MAKRRFFFEPALGMYRGAIDSTTNLSPSQCWLVCCNRFPVGRASDSHLPCNINKQKRRTLFEGEDRNRRYEDSLSRRHLYRLLLRSIFHLKALILSEKRTEKSGSWYIKSFSPPISLLCMQSHHCVVQHFIVKVLVSSFTEKYIEWMKHSVWTINYDGMLTVTVPKIKH